LGHSEFSKIRSIVEEEIDSYFTNKRALGYSHITKIKNKALDKYFGSKKVTTTSLRL